MEAVNINFLVVGLMISCSGTLKEEEEQTETSQILVFWHIVRTSTKGLVIADLTK
jgi:hypothetical protein